MAKIETRAITTKPRRQTKHRASNELAAYNRRMARHERALRAETFRSDGVMRCSRCPPTHGCDDCARINKGRVYAGLIRPRGSPEPHLNNTLIPVVFGKLKGGKPDTPLKGASQLVSMDITPLGGGWFLSEATLGMDTIYSRRCRGREAALTFARASMLCIRQGLDFERENG